MKEEIKKLAGSILAAIQPKRAFELAKRGMTIVDDDTFSLADRLMRNAILSKAEKEGDFDALAEFQRNYWVNRGKDFFFEMDDSFKNAFLPDCAFIFDILKEKLEKENTHFNTLVEIGTGNGKVLEYLGSKFPGIDRLVGIDLSPDQIIINHQKFKKKTRFEFVASDGFEWVREHGHGNMIFVTSRGVLEYFTEKRLKDFFELLNSLGKIVIVAIEPNGVDHDFAKNPKSQPYGQERSFSHNYPLLFKNAGFRLWHHSKKPYAEEVYYFSFIGAMN